jgi:hypothetical protein
MITTAVSRKRTFLPPERIQTFFEKRLFVMLWLLLTAININKAYHIDDSFHLEVAAWIKEHPLQPMSGAVNWSQLPEPIFVSNQPPLFFYLILVFQYLFGTSEIALHLLLSIFTFLALYYFVKLTKLLEVKHSQILLVLFACCPAFVVNQNLMTDIPLLSLILATLFYLLKGQQSGILRHYLIAAALLSAGLLVKYTILPLVVVFTLTILLSGFQKNLIALFVPVTIMLLWSTWNYYEFGSVHLLMRKTKSVFYVSRIWGYMSALGAVSFFSSAFFFHLLPFRATRIAVVIFWLAFWLMVPLVYVGSIKNEFINHFLNIFFIINGCIIYAWLIKYIFFSFWFEKINFLKSPACTLILYILGMSLFIILFAPFNATRHVLLVIPILLLVGHRVFEKTRGVLNHTIIATTFFIGILLGVSDWIYADFYRRGAKEIHYPNKKIWTTGHWGWQWYSKQSGMHMYSSDSLHLMKPGDIVVYPKNISRQSFSPQLIMKSLDTIAGASGCLTFFSGKKYASLYISSDTKPAWNLSNAPIDTIFIKEVVSIKIK